MPPSDLYRIVDETTEDRYDETYTLADAIRIARGLAEEHGPEDAVSIDFNGRIINQFVRTARGVVDRVTA